MENLNWSKSNNRKVAVKDYVVEEKSANDLEKNLTYTDYYEMLLVDSGNASFIIEGRSNIVTSGDVILLSPNEIHNFGDSESKDFSFLSITLSARYMQSLSTPLTDLSLAFHKASKLHKNIIKADDKYIKRLSTLLQLIKGGKESSSKFTYGQDVLSTIHISTFLVTLNRLALEDIDESATDTSFIDKIIIYIEQNADKDLSIENIANEFGLSAFRLSHFFKEQTKLTLHQFVLQKRLAMSKQYILSGVYVKDTAKLCGFNDVSNFFRAFKEAFSITPKDYYKMMKE